MSAAAPTTEMTTAITAANTTEITRAIIITADTIAEINREHHLARESAETAIENAVRCGHLLIHQKHGMKHGEFMPWVKANCQFSQATANNYMRAAQNPNALAISTAVRHLYLSERQIERDERVRDLRNLERSIDRHRRVRLSRKDLMDLRLHGELREHLQAVDDGDNNVKKAQRAVRRAREGEHRAEEEARKRHASVRVALDAFRTQQAQAASAQHQ